MGNGVADALRNAMTASGAASGIVATILLCWLALPLVRGPRKPWAGAQIFGAPMLILVAAVHGNMHFGWNAGTLAFAAMLPLIGCSIMDRKVAAEGRAYGDDGLKLLVELRAIDRKLHEAALPLDDSLAAIVRLAVEDDPFAAGPLGRITGTKGHCRTESSAALLQHLVAEHDGTADPMLAPVAQLMVRKQNQLAAIRDRLRVQARREIWHYLQAPLLGIVFGSLLAHLVIPQSVR